MAAIFICAINAYAKYDHIVDVFVTPKAGNWTVPLNANPDFEVMVLESGLPAVGTIEYKIFNDLSPKTITGSVALVNGKASLKGIKAKASCFEQCSVTYTNPAGAKYSGMGTIAFYPEGIKPVVEDPKDFDQYWQKAIEQAQGDLNIELTPLPDRSTKKVDVYRMSFSAGNAGRFYGMLSVPKGDGKYPAVVQYPGAGVYVIDPNYALAEKGMMCLTFNIHGIAPDLAVQVYSDLAAGALRSYYTINMDNPENYYYRKVVQGAVRAVDAMKALPFSNGKVAVSGGSQGGYLSVAVAALNPNVCFLSCNYPALSDMAAYTKYTTGGWPHIVKNEANRTPEIMHTLSLFDTVNFARRLKTPGLYSFGYNDLTCAPRTCFGVYNSITAPKELLIAPLTGHYTTQEQRDAVINALEKGLRE